MTSRQMLQAAFDDVQLKPSPGNYEIFFTVAKMYLQDPANRGDMPPEEVQQLILFFMNQTLRARQYPDYLKYNIRRGFSMETRHQVLGLQRLP